jgi:glycosyltransferase involved in cell wall biosynthesis
MDQSVTIGIPTFKRPKQFKTALRSACIQTYSNLKIIVSDNAGDGESVAADMRDSRIQYFKQPHNIGANPSFLWLLDRADTDFFMWLADDDQLGSPDYISQVVEQFHRDDSAKVVFPDCDILYESGASPAILTPHFHGCATDRDYLIAWCKFGGGQPFYGMYRTSHLRALNPARTFREWAYYGEGIFLHRAFLKGGVRFCSNARLIYNGDNSSTRIRSRKMLASFLRYTAETHGLYLSSGHSLRTKIELLRLIGRSHYPYVRHLARKSIFNQLGG